MDNNVEVLGINQTEGVICARKRSVTFPIFHHVSIFFLQKYKQMYEITSAITRILARIHPSTLVNTGLNLVPLF